MSLPPAREHLSAMILSLSSMIPLMNDLSNGVLGLVGRWKLSKIEINLEKHILSALADYDKYQLLEEIIYHPPGEASLTITDYLVMAIYNVDYGYTAIEGGKNAALTVPGNNGKFIIRDLSANRILPPENSSYHPSKYELHDG